MIPDELRNRDQWILWSAESDPPKKPLNADGYGASWNDPNAWLPYDDARELADANDQFDGIGFVVTENDPYLGLDLDGCLREPGEPKPKDWLPPIEAFTDTFMQYSTSGTGLHAFVRDQRVPEWWADSHFSDDEHEGVEAYTEKFFIMTGDQVEAAADTINEVDVAPFLADAYEAINGEPPQLPGGDDEPTTDTDLDVYDVISRSQHPVGENVAHPFHPSSTGTNFRVDPGGETFRCWRHSVTGNAAHLLGIEQGVMECGDWSPSGLDSDTWRDIFDAGRDAGYSLPEPDGGSQQNPVEDSGTTANGGELNLSGVARVLQLEDADDVRSENAARKAYAVWKLIEDSEKYHITARRPDGTVFAYHANEGIWRDDGEHVARAAARRALGSEYSEGVGREIVEQARTAPGGQRYQDQFGVPDGSIMMANGLLDMDAREVQPPQPSDYALRRLPVEFNPDATAERWHEFVNEVVEDGKEDVVQEYVGYTLMVDQLPYHKALLLVGEGANGKTTFLETIRALFGRENLCATSLQRLADNKFARAGLYGSLANVDADLSAEAIGNGGMFKKLLGNDRIQAERKYHDPFEFDPTQKHLYAANEVPDVDVDDDAFYRRWLLVEFPNYFPPGERDPNLLDDLTTDESLSGILNWALDGRDRLLDQDGFSDSPLPGATRERWRGWGDAVTQFVNDCIEPDEAGRFSTTEAYARFKTWHRENEHGKPPSQRRLTNEIKTSTGANYKKNVRISGTQKRGFEGVAFTDDAPEGQDSDGDPAQASL